MQLHADTAKRFGVKNVFDPTENLEGGVKYLRFLLDYFKNDLSLALAGYNAGENAVTRYKGIPPYRGNPGLREESHHALPAARGRADGDDLSDAAAPP